MVKQRLDSLSIQHERFPAVDGTQPPWKYVWQKLPFFMESPGPLGLLVTIRHLLTISSQKGYRRILILEDDVCFHRHFTSLFAKIIPTLPSWKLLYLGCSMHTWRYRERCRTHPTYWVPRGSVPGAFALGIDASVFSELFYHVNTLRSPWDLGPLRAINQKYHGQVIVTRPHLAIADVRQSDNRGAKTLPQKAHDCGWNVSHYVI